MKQKSKEAINDISLKNISVYFRYSKKNMKMVLTCLVKFMPQLPISRSSQCSTTGVTKAVVCAILSVGWCI